MGLMALIGSWKIREIPPPAYLGNLFLVRLQPRQLQRLPGLLIEMDLSGADLAGPGNDAEHGLSGNALARTAFSYDPQDASPADLITDAVNGLDRPFGHIE
jgi:hypothetical protein